MRLVVAAALATLTGLIGFSGGCSSEPAAVRPGVDVAHAAGFPELRGRVGLITNATGRLIDGTRTIDALLADGVELVRLFSPEHGLATDRDGSVDDARDPATGLEIVSLYGADRRPPARSLRDLDVLAFDVQDAGARFYTYLSTLTLALEAAADDGDLRFVVFDRPNPLGGTVVEGPGRDPGRASFTAIHDVPVRHGMTLGELARLVVAERGLDVELTVVPCQGWRRAQTFDATGLPWRDPSPNLKTLAGNRLYPGLALLEFTNLSVGRGTATPFELVGAPWLDARSVADALAGAFADLGLDALACEPVAFTPGTGPYAGEPCAGVRFDDRGAESLRAVPVGLALACVLRDLHGDEWDATEIDRLLASKRIAQALRRGAPPVELVRIADEARPAFLARRRPYLLYPE